MPFGALVEAAVMVGLVGIRKSVKEWEGWEEEERIAERDS